MTLDEILAESPKLKGREGREGQTAFYSVFCCWWTSFPDDLGRAGRRTDQLDAGEWERMKVDDDGIPGCPHCGSVLMEAPLQEFIASAAQNPDHYGPGRLSAFERAHERNAHCCHRDWEDYEPIPPALYA